MTDVLVAIPAHEEEREIAGCLEHLAAAVGLAQQPPARHRVAVTVAAHRCTDATFDVARSLLAGLPGTHRVVRDEVSQSVGEVRAGLFGSLAAHPGLDPSSTWLFSTDGDSHVPPDWIVSTLAQATRQEATAVLGMVELRAWDATPEAHERYRRLVRDGLGEDGHDHVYGANLAVRLDAYDRVGGFRPVHAEDQDLADRLRAGGERVLSLRSPLVRTSARSPGRAAGALGDLLDRMRGAPHVAPLGGAG